MSDTLVHQYQKVHAFLKHNPMAVLSTVTPDGIPWGSAIYYVSDEDFNFYFVTRVETQKYKNIDNSPVAAITVADNDSQTTVQVTGTISQLPVKDYMEVIFEKLASIRPKNNLQWTPPLTKIHEGNYMPLKLTPTKLQYADFSHMKSDIYADYIEQIIS